MVPSPRTFPLLLALLGVTCTRTPAPSADPAAPPTPTGPGPTLVERFGDHPFLTPIDAPATVALTRGGTVGVDPASCGACHPDHLAEWSATTHAAAVDDLQFLAELSKPDQPRWLCLNCHAPTIPQRAERITAETRLARADDVRALVTEPNPTFDAARLGEGVGCATCHVRRDADGEGIVVGPRGSGRAPHRVRKDRDALDGICVRCHSPGDVRITPTLPCWFQTREEIAAGPSPGTGCPDCHMPETTRPAATGGPTVTLRRHAWTGGGVPKSADGYATLLGRGWRSALAVRVDLDPVRVALTNAGAAHALPTADPERHLRVEARWEDTAGTVLARDVLRVGQTWDWGDAATGRIAHRTGDNRLLPGETRTWLPDLPPGSAGRLVVEVTHMRLTAANARGMAETLLVPEASERWPEAATLLPRIDTVYPMASRIYRETVELPEGRRTVDPPEALLAASRAWMDLPLDEKARRLDIAPAP